MSEEVAEVGAALSPFFSAFCASFAMVVVSEIGDKTFFVAAILAMKHARLVVFSGAISALGLMTILSVVFGYMVPGIIPREYTHYAAIGLFAVFGVLNLREGWLMDPNDNDELEEVEAELSKKDLNSNDSDMEEGHNVRSKGVATTSLAACLLSPIFAQAFTMTFLGEWGDRSQITTIALAASRNPYGVAVGGVLAHSICTGVAVIGGRLLASRISEKTVALSGGALFVFFAILSLVQGPEDIDA
eukprot:TRINITY_DN1635_c0_g1::TRINITY_DN1635_c0_g1_i1::g.17639::m.17639 TRINITY_DN1635_c0_g1::TRINITY_DN1635_c0_g1_i1::g.17639  ORF type:complete len:245 (+),score=35.75,sp/Q9HC07/TM165_HUMAN/52.17/3e-73,UPF0016/PF01169.14/1.1e-21,UPF0016/PF01169.14/1.8e-22,DUF21/PF01595.15/0.28,DUF21/PF01595.15/53 TRINITY_DN1635_c0_g1_i1:75-809(+)